MLTSLSLPIPWGARRGAGSSTGRPHRGLLLVLLLAATSARAPGQDAPTPVAPGPTEPAPTEPAPTEPAAGGPAPTGLPPGISREQMWFAPTAEDWARPCLITFQRTWDDAQAVSRATGKPILVCVNMDGEIASEHYAGVRYRRPETAALYEPYVTVIASVYRHNPADHDSAGRRILCPRFGSVTCGEHIAIEPILYEKFLDGRRIAPRHIGVDEGEREMYDVFYAWDTDSVFAAIREGVADRPAPVPLVRGDRPLAERVADADVLERQAVEREYEQGGRPMREALLQAALAAGEDAPVELLRLALAGHDGGLVRLARSALAGARGPGAVDLLVEQLDQPLEPAEREALLAALDALGAESPRARTVAVVHRGLAGASRSVQAEAWLQGLEAEAPAAADVHADPARQVALMEQQDATLASNDAEAHLELAEAFLAAAWAQPAAEAEYGRLLYMDARRTVERAVALGAYGWRVDSDLAVAAYYLGDLPEAHARAVAAVTAGASARQSSSWNAAATLAIFAQARQEAIRKALREQAPWPPEWISDVHAACLVLARHPFGTEEQIAAHHEFLRSLSASAQAAEMLDAGLERFPASALLHEQLRRRVLAERGITALEDEYAARAAAPGADASLPYFAGQASFEAAEFRRRAGQRDEAHAAYDRAVAWWEQDIARRPEQRAAADEGIALAWAAQARLAFEAGDAAGAVEKLLASLERRPQAAATLDGLNLSPADTARTLLAHLRESGATELAGRLEQVLAALDPELLRLPAYEREVPPPAERTGRRGRRGPDGPPVGGTSSSPTGTSGEGSPRDLREPWR